MFSVILKGLSFNSGPLDGQQKRFEDATLSSVSSLKAIFNNFLTSE